MNEWAKEDTRYCLYEVSALIQKRVIPKANGRLIATNTNKECLRELAERLMRNRIRQSFKDGSFSLYDFKHGSKETIAGQIVVNRDFYADGQIYEPKTLLTYKYEILDKEF